MKTFIISLLCIITLTTCKKTAGPEGPKGPAGPAGPTGSTSSGTLTGTVKLYDHEGLKLTSGLDSVLVTVKGSTLSANTNTNGEYSISGVPAGMQTLVFSRPGFGTIENQQLSFAGNGVMYSHASLSKKPVWTILDAKITGNSGPYLMFGFTITPVPYQTRILVILGKNATPDISQPASYEHYYLISIAPGYPSVTNGNSYQNASPAPIQYQSGTIFYAKAYPFAFGAKTYFDYSANKEVFSGTGTEFSKVFPLVIP